jgi:hypothetical protein
MATSPEDPSHRRIYEQLKQAHRFYSFDRRTYGHEIEDITLLAVMAPTGAGKSTLINETLAIDDEIHMYQSSTTRPPEARDTGEYRVVPIEEFETAIAARSLVNYFPHPNGHIYGTFTSGFKAPVTIGAIAAASLEQLMDAGFREVRTVYTVMDGATYATRLGLDTIARPDSRMASPDIRKRLEEGRTSLSFAEANAEEDWFTSVRLTNGEHSLHHSARNLARIAHDRTAESVTAPHARQLIAEMRAVIDEAIDRLDTVQ